MQWRRGALKDATDLLACVGFSPPVIVTRSQALQVPLATTGGTSERTHLRNLANCAEEGACSLGTALPCHV